MAATLVAAAGLAELVEPHQVAVAPIAGTAAPELVEPRQVAATLVGGASFNLVPLIRWALQDCGQSPSTTAGAAAGNRRQTQAAC